MDITSNNSMNDVETILTNLATLNGPNTCINIEFNPHLTASLPDDKIFDYYKDYARPSEDEMTQALTNKSFWTLIVNPHMPDGTWSVVASTLAGCVQAAAFKDANK